MPLSSVSDANAQIERATLRLMLSLRRLPTTMALLCLVMVGVLSSRTPSNDRCRKKSRPRSAHRLGATTTPPRIPTEGAPTAAEKGDPLLTPSHRASAGPDLRTPAPPPHG